VAWTYLHVNQRPCCYSGRAGKVNKNKINCETKQRDQGREQDQKREENEVRQHSISAPMIEAVKPQPTRHPIRTFGTWSEPNKQNEPYVGTLMLPCDHESRPLFVKQQQQGSSSHSNR
jgi:hypothetical protein